LFSLESAQEKVRQRITLGKRLLTTHIDSESALTEAKHEKDRWTDFNIELMTRLVSGSEYAERYRKFPHGLVSAPSYTLDKKITMFRESVAGQINQLNSDLERLSLVPQVPPLQAPTVSGIHAVQNVFNGPVGNIAQHSHDVQQTANTGSMSGGGRIALVTLIVSALGVVAAWLTVPGFLK